MSGHLFETKNIVAVQSYTCFCHPAIVLEFATFLWTKSGRREETQRVSLTYISTTSLYFYGWPQGGRGRRDQCHNNSCTHSKAQSIDPGRVPYI